MEVLPIFHIIVSSVRLVGLSLPQQGESCERHRISGAAVNPMER
jgi:hypothetical protein